MALKKGICKNFGECSLADDKIVQEVDSTNFVCEECGSSLYECDGKNIDRSNSNTDSNTTTSTGNGGKTVKILLGCVAGLAVLGGGGYWYANRTPATVEEAVQVLEIPEAVPDTTVQAEPVQKTPESEKKPTPTNGKGTIDLGYAVYTGDLKNGKPHGYGTLTYKTSRKIVSSKDFVASPGDTFEGDFRDGKISGLGYWKHDGNVTAVKP